MFDLKVSDLPELERLAADGYEWIARDKIGVLWAYILKPYKSDVTPIWVFNAFELGEHTNVLSGMKRIQGNMLAKIKYADPEPLNIAAAIAQIKAMKKLSGCDFCTPEDDVESVAVYGVRVGESVREAYSTRGMVQELAKFCPMCGTPLSQPVRRRGKGMSAEYIERGAALEMLKEVVYAELASDADNGRANYIIGAIENLPAADVEPVVR